MKLLDTDQLDAANPECARYYWPELRRLDAEIEQVTMAIAAQYGTMIDGTDASSSEDQAMVLGILWQDADDLAMILLTHPGVLSIPQGYLNDAEPIGPYWTPMLGRWT